MQGRRALAGAYFALAVPGTLVPFAAFFPWLAKWGIDIPQFLADLFVNPVSSFFAIDVIFSALTLAIFIVAQARRDSVGFWWVPLAATFLIGVSCGLPLFLGMRELSMRKA